MQTTASKVSIKGRKVEKDPAKKTNGKPVEVKDTVKDDKLPVVPQSTKQLPTLTVDEIIAFTNEVTALVDKAKDFKIVDTQTREEANLTLSAISSMQKKLEERRVAITKPILEEKSDIDGKFKLIKQPLATIESALRQEVLRDVNEQNRIAEEERKKAEELARAEKEKVQQTFGGNSNPLLKAIVEQEKEKIDAKVSESVPETVSQIKTVAGTNSVRSVIKFEILDATKVPDEYKTIDESKIRNAITRKEDRVTEIPGVRIFEESALTVRGAKV